MKNIKTYEEFKVMKNIKTYEEFKGITFKELDNFNKYDKSAETLCLDYLKLTNLDGIEEFDNLKILNANNNRITSLKGIGKMPKLINFWCYSNNLTNLDGIENLENLEMFVAHTNKLTSIKGIENLTKLTSLYLGANDNIDLVDYVDNKGNKWYIELPKSLIILHLPPFESIEEYRIFMNKHQTAGVSKKFNF